MEQSPKKKIFPASPELRSMKSKLRSKCLHTVCEEARCPNIGECFKKGTATFMILGKVCTRSCKFCGVANIATDAILPPNADEPKEIAKMVSELSLKHVVITSVTRDDLKDEGADQFFETIKQIKANTSGTIPSIEVLTPDFHAREDLLKMVCNAKPDVFNHNIETVRRLTPSIRSNADYDRSLRVLKYVAENFSDILVKSGIMVGLGETKEEVVETLADLCNASVSVVTIGQYFAPAKSNAPVAKIYSDEEFASFKEIGEKLGIRYIFSGRFVRSSYMAEEAITIAKK